MSHGFDDPHKSGRCSHNAVAEPGCASTSDDGTGTCAVNPSDVWQLGLLCAFVGKRFLPKSTIARTAKCQFDLVIQESLSGNGMRKEKGSGKVATCA